MMNAEDILRSFIGDLIKKISPQSLLGNNVRIKEGWIDARDVRTGVSLSVPLPKKGRIFILSVGKAAVPMMASFRGLDGIPRRCEVRYLVLSNCVPGDSSMEDELVLEGNHPFPDHRDVGNAEKVKAFLSDTHDGDLVVLLLSGGASSLLFSPREGVNPEFKAGLIRQLMLAGADITALNTVRTYLSDSKGGGLLQWSGGAEVLSLIFSDVLGDDLRFVGSGPTFPFDPSMDDAISVMERLGADVRSIETVRTVPPRHPHRPLKPFQNVVIGNSDSVLKASSEILTTMGFDPFVERTKFSGEARIAASSILGEARRSLDASRKDSYLRGGETVVTVKGPGRGGRNLELALSMAPLLRKDETALCLATDGSDGNSGMAGAWVDRSTGPASEILRALSENDSAGFFDPHPGGIRTGPTGQNLGDLFLLLRGPPKLSRGHRRPEKPI